MSLLKDLKNIFFGASALGKSATEKATDFVKEEGDEILDKAKDLASQSGEILMEKTSGLKETILSSSSTLLDKTKDFGDSISNNPLAEKVKGMTENVGDTVLDKGGDLMDKAGELSENVGEVVMDKGQVLLDKSADLSENVGSKVLDVKDKVMEKAGEVKEQLSDKLEDTMEKADAWAENEKNNPKTEFAEDTIDASGSLLEGTDDFFSKADKFAGGDYAAFSEGKISVDETAKELPTKKFDELPPATGFKDLDGDGNELIDDAIIDDK